MNDNTACCDACRSRPATVACVRVRSNDARSVRLCEQCARDWARLHTGSVLAVRPVLDSRRAGGNREHSPDVCKVCNKTCREVSAEQRPGCCACYVNFREEMEKSIFSAQGCTRHTGKSPGL